MIVFHIVVWRYDYCHYKYRRGEKRKEARLGREDWLDTRRREISLDMVRGTKQKKMRSTKRRFFSAARCHTHTHTTSNHVMNHRPALSKIDKDRRIRMPPFLRMSFTNNFLRDRRHRVESAQLENGCNSP